MVGLAEEGRGVGISLQMALCRHGELQGVGERRGGGEAEEEICISWRYGLHPAQNL